MDFDITGVASSAIAGLCTVAAAAVPILIVGRKRRRAEKSREDLLGAIHEQVANTHTTNLRDDLDRLHEAVERLTRESRKSLREIRQAVDSQVQRIDRISSDIGDIRKQAAADRERLTDHIDGR